MSSLLQKFKELNVYVAVPSQGMWVADFGTSLCNMLTTCGSHRIENYKTQKIHTMSSKGSVLPKLRWNVVEECQKKEADYLLFVDSDQTFPRSTLHRLIKHGKDCVGANIATKTIPTQPTARIITKEEPIFGSPVYTDPESKGLQKVWRVGTGLVLLSKKAINTIKPEDFDMYWREDVKLHQGEDWTMFAALEKAGIDVWVDHDLSKEVGHVGLFEFTHEYTGEVKHVGHTVSRAA